MTQRQVTYRAELAGGQQVEGGFRRIGKSGYEAYEQIDRGQKSAEKSAKTFERMLDREAKSFRALKASVDPAYAAQQRFERAQEQVNRAVQLGVVSQRDAAQVLQQLQARSRGAAAAMEMVDTAAVGANQGLRNSLLQVNQIGQQVAAGGGLMSAVAIQLPDILGGFGGLVPLIAGAAVGLGSAFIPKLFEAEEAAEDLRGTLESAYSSASTALDAAREAQERYTTAIQLSGQAQSAITPQVLNSLAAEARAREALAKLEEAQLNRRSVMFESSIRRQRAELDNLVADATAGIVSDPNDAFVNSAAEQARAAAVARVLDENEDLVLSLREQQAELDLINALLAQNWGEAARMVDEMAEAAAEGRDLSNTDVGAGIRSAVDDAYALAEQLGIARGVAMDIVNRGPVTRRLDEENPDFFDPRNETAGAGRLPPSMRPKPQTEVRRVSSGRSGGGGGGASANKLDREALRIQRATTTALEKRNRELALGQRLLDSGKITQETYNRHVAATREAYRQATEGQQSFSRHVKMGKDAIINAVMGQKNAFEQLKQSIKRAAIEYALFQTVGGQPVKGGLGGFAQTLLGGLLPSFDAGGYTGSGPRSGGLDGKGGFLAVMHSNEDVRPRRGGAPHGGDNREPMVPVFGIGDGVQVRWMREAEARSAAQIGQYGRAQRDNYGTALQEYQQRGTL